MRLTQNLKLKTEHKRSHASAAVAADPQRELHNVWLLALFYPFLRFIHIVAHVSFLFLLPNDIPW